jgi:glutaminyl-peptide cyclotransferase
MSFHSTFHSHLAEKWDTEFISPIQARKLNRQTTQLGAIEVLVLLDLLGAPKPVIPSFFASTAWLYDGLVAAEHRLGRLGLFNDPNSADPEAIQWHTWSSFFMPRTHYQHNVGVIEDDHIPFLHRGVNILHLIPRLFPRVWHSLGVCNLPFARVFQLIPVCRTMLKHWIFQR